MQACAPDIKAFENFVTLVFPDGTSFQVNKNSLEPNSKKFRLNSYAYLHVFSVQRPVSNGPKVEVSQQIVDKVYADYAAHKTKAA